MKTKTFILTILMLTISIPIFCQQYTYKKYMCQINKDIEDKFNLLENGYLIIKNLGNGKFYIKAVNNKRIFISTTVTFTKSTSNNNFYYKGNGEIGEENETSKYEITIETYKYKLNDFAKGIGNEADFRVEKLENIIQFEMYGEIDSGTMNIVPILN